ncbi:MAG: type II toxin-antitoxin system RelE/ParE family toxin [Clostridia bacterium]|jgi:addiction module RelE/StbE family toxin|nr:type II toxin-antitoxin system RelE/ParE family toxin [Clostridia bacterium]
MVIHWTKYALQDLKEFSEYSKKNNVQEYIEKLIKSVGNLKEFPKLGHIYTYSQQYIIRKYVHEEHIVLYYVDNNIIHILVAVHHKQDINKKLNFIKNIIETDIV